ncbi:hypothetical protein [Levilactobacillus bambusae]|uniref:Uncharacterized protein n=1 Tax=Levilactobacillus bambusae TaxID=2024736 RepID=A0A2V1N6E6_9LACO|nr:hypothetical protein [Levilactobacillus bambusae]PWG01050.1 hypothetical protein DCM90_02420 [Levilactobacillus bambusae]
MGLKNFAERSIVTAGIGLAFHLIQTRQNPIDWGKEKVNDVRVKVDQYQEFQASRRAVQHNLTKLQEAIQNAQPVITDIQTDINKFEFKIQPRVAKLNDAINRLNGQDSTTHE